MIPDPLTPEENQLLEAAIARSALMDSPIKGEVLPAAYWADFNAGFDNPDPEETAQYVARERARCAELFPAQPTPDNWDDWNGIICG